VGVLGQDEVMVDDLAGLRARSFERMSQALAVQVLGPGLEVFGDGPDGGREASFEGKLRYPSAEAPWDGFGILQAKFKSAVSGTGVDTTWLRTRIKAELEAWADPDKRRVRDGRRPKYLIFATNVALSAVPGRGGKDRIDKLIRDYAPDIGLEDWRVWDATQITTFLDTYPDLRRAFAALITPNEVLAAMHDRLSAPLEANVVVSVPAVVIRPGQPGQEAAFQAAYTAAGGAARLGHALGEVYFEGPGWIQHFEGTPQGSPAVICARAGGRAIALAAPVWNALCAVGGGAPGAGIADVGFPVAGQPGAASFITADSAAVELVRMQTFNL
jgi:hypothetical protein